MKRLLFIIPLIILSLLVFSYDQQSTSSVIQNLNSISSVDSIQNQSKKLSADYFIDVDLNTEEKSLSVKEKIIWFNFSNSSTSELQFHLYANAFSNNKTELAKRTYFEKDEQTKIVIDKLLIDGQPKAFIYFNPEIENKFDSTVAKVELDKLIAPGDSVIIEIEYLLEIPKSTVRFGYAAGSDFYFIAQWFPKLGVYKNGEWICSQYHPFTEFYSDFANYYVNITVPHNYTVGTSGKTIVSEDKPGQYKVEAENIIDFAWTASPEFISIQDKYKSRFGKEIEITFLIQPENDDLRDRLLTAAKNTIEYLEENIGEYPYSNITLVDVPRSSNLGGMEYPGIVTYFTPLFTPIKLQKPESTIIHEIIHQYFYASLSSNEVYEGWLDEGITTYLEEKILLEYYGKPVLYFNFIDYYPIFGLKFLSFREIPLIYTLRYFEIDSYAYSLANYYANNGIGNLDTKSYLLPGYRSTMANVYAKPNLILHSLEKYAGEETVNRILSEYYNRNKFSIVTSNEFILSIQNHDDNFEWFTQSFIGSEQKYDYKLSSISQKNDTTYSIFIERLEEGVVPTKIGVYTTADTTYFNWSGKERWKEFTVNSKTPVIAAEVDPENKNILDLNYANNSFIVEQKYWASLSMAIRWFFWIQNTLLIFGSLG